MDRAVDAKDAARKLAAGVDPTELIEIGPRMVLDVVRIFAHSMGGPTLYSNPDYLSPNRLRHELNVLRAGKYTARKGQEGDRERRDAELVLPEDPLDAVFKDDKKE